MTSFVHVDQPATHPGVERAEEFIDGVIAIRKRFDGARGLAALLLAAIVSSLLVVADKLMSTWTEDGGLLVAWVVLWAVAFVSLAFFADSARGFAVRMVTGARAASRRRAEARADEEFMAYAKFDPRVLRDLQAISSHQEAFEEVAAAARPQAIVAPRGVQPPSPSFYESAHRAQIGKYY